jgi:hypothetical protein
MSLEEPDIATAGTGEPDHDGTRPREQRVALFASTVLLVILAAAAVVAVTWGPTRSFEERTTVARRADRPDPTDSDPGLEADPTTTSSSTTTTIGLAAPPTSTAPAGTAPDHGPSYPVAPPTTAPAPQPLPPGVPVVTVGPAGPGGCTASWTVADGGAPIIDYRVLRESAPASAVVAGVDIGRGTTLDRMTATTATVELGGTISVSAHNAIGDSAYSEPQHCG